MTDAELTLLISSIVNGTVGIVNGFGIAFLTYLSRQQILRAEVQLSETMKNAGAIQDIHNLTNHLKDELVAEVRAASYAKGRKDEGESNGGSRGQDSS